MHEDVANHESLCGPPKVKRKTLDLNQKNDGCRNTHSVMINIKISK